MGSLQFGPTHVWWWFGLCSCGNFAWGGKLFRSKEWSADRPRSRFGLQAHWAVEVNFEICVFSESAKCFKSMHSKSFRRNLAFVSGQVFALNCWMVSESCRLSWSLTSATGRLSFACRAPSVAISSLSWSFNMLVVVSLYSSARKARP